jgi:hypothetical protein
MHLLETATDWERCCRETVSELLDTARITRPPVDAFELARKLGLHIAWDAGQVGRGRLKRFAGRSAILLKPDERPERLHWTVAHEIGEAFAHRVFEQLDVAPDTCAPRRREQVANAMASALLLPHDWFLTDSTELDADVLALKRIYTTASHELILMETLGLGELAMVSVFDHGRLTRRRGNGQLPPPRLLPIEREVWKTVHVSGRAAERSRDGVRVQGWPVHEPGWKRELLRASPLEGVDAAETIPDDEYGESTELAEFSYC